MDYPIGTTYFIAPEVLSCSYNQKCDVWSMGVILFLLLSGTYPFDGENDSEVLKNIRVGSFEFKPELWESISEGAMDLI